LIRLDRLNRKAILTVLPQSGSAAIHYAAKHKEDEMLKALLEAGVDPIYQA